MIISDETPGNNILCCYQCKWNGDPTKCNFYKYLCPSEYDGPEYAFLLQMIERKVQSPDNNGL